jgi:hypothetical protein
MKQKQQAVRIQKKEKKLTLSLISSSLQSELVLYIAEICLLEYSF